MIQIALADFEGTEGARLGRNLAESLRARKYKVAMFQPGPSIIRSLEESELCPDILYLYVQSPDGRAEIYLDQLQCFWRERGPRPLVQCILESFFGVRLHLTLEKRLARVAYAPRRLEEGK